MKPASPSALRKAAAERAMPWGVPEFMNPITGIAGCRARHEWPRDYTAADKCDEFPPPHGADPKVKDHGRSIAGLEVGQWRASQSKGRPMTTQRHPASRSALEFLAGVQS